MQATCSLCGGQEKVLAYGSINTAEDPDLKAKVKDGSLFVWECPHCGGYNLARYQTLYHDPDQKLMVWLMPEGSMPPEQLAAVQQHMEIIAEQAFDGEEGYTLRRVGDIGSLMEKVNIFDANLDDRVIELYKFLIWDQIKEAWPDLQEGDLLFMYDEDDAYLVVWPSDNGSDEKLTTPIEPQFYQELVDSCGAALEIPAGQYAEIDQKWIAQRFER